MFHEGASDFIFCCMIDFKEKLAFIGYRKQVGLR